MEILSVRLDGKLLPFNVMTLPAPPGCKFNPLCNGLIKPCVGRCQSREAAAIGGKGDA
jgi:hypothetical protein